jgi:hypothetical protein
LRSEYLFEESFNQLRIADRQTVGFTALVNPRRAPLVRRDQLRSRLLKKDGAGAFLSTHPLTGPVADQCKTTMIPRNGVGQKVSIDRRASHEDPFDESGPSKGWGGGRTLYDWVRFEKLHSTRPVALCWRTDRESHGLCARNSSLWSGLRGRARRRWFQRKGEKCKNETAAEARSRNEVDEQERGHSYALRCEKTERNYASLVALTLGFILIKSVHTA